MKPQGTCPVCFAEKALRKDGMLGRHGSGKKNVWPPQVCDGWTQPPVEAQEKQHGTPDHSAA